MPRVSIYRGNAIQREGVTPARFVPADFSASPLGEGLQRLGRGLGEYAEKEDQIQSIYDEQDAQRLDLEHVKQTQELSDRLRQARGAGAQEAATQVTHDLESYNSTLLGRARSPRARLILENSIARRSAGEVERYHTYADQEFVQDFRATNDAGVTSSLERAADIPDREQSRAELENTAFALIRRRAEFEGWQGGADGPQAQAYRLRVTNAYHLSRARQMGRGDAREAMDYAIAHRDEMTAESLNGILDSFNSEALDQWAEQQLDGAPAQTPANDDSTPRPAREETPIAYQWHVNSGVGHRTPPTAGASSNHAGTDYEVPVGTAVPVTLSGRVTFAGQQHGYGNIVIVDHGGGIETRYAHLSRINVHPGEQVSRGDVIAASGMSGRVTGAHLHYEIRRDGVPVNPRSVTNARVHPGGTGRIETAAGTDVETQVQAIRSRDDLSFRQQQALIGAVRRRHGEAMQARAQSENETDRAAAGRVAELGDGFTSMSQLPNGGADLGPQDRLRYSSMAQSNRRQAESEPPSPDLMFWINYNRYARPGFYASADFLQQARQHGASASMLRSIAAEQGQLVGTRIPADRAHIWSVAEPILQAAGINLDTLDPTSGQRDAQRTAAERQQDAVRKNNLLSNLEQLHTLWTGAHPGQTPPDDLIREWVSRSTAQSGAGPVALLAETDNELVARLNPRDRATAERALRSQNLPINDQTVAMAVRYRLALTRRAQ